MNSKIISSYLRPAKAECLDGEWDRYIDRSDSLRLTKYVDLCIVPRGLVDESSDSDRWIVDDCDYGSEIIDTAHSDAVLIPGKTLYGGYFRRCWGHFLVNTVARLWPVLGSEKYDRIVFFNEEDQPVELRDNYAEMFSLLGIEDKVEILRWGEYVFEDLTVGEPAFRIMKHTSDEFMKIFSVARKEALDRATSSISGGVSC